MVGAAAYRQIARVVGAAALGALAAWLYKQGEVARQEAALLELWRLTSTMPDPSELTPEQVRRQASSRSHVAHLGCLLMDQGPLLSPRHLGCWLIFGSRCS